MESASKTHIMYSVGMSYAQLRKYLKHLMDRGFLGWSDDTYPGGLYTVTDKGRALLESIERIERMLYIENDASTKPRVVATSAKPLARISASAFENGIEFRDRVSSHRS